MTFSYLQVPAYAAKGRFHKGGANRGLRAFGIAKIISLVQGGGKKKITVSSERSMPGSRNAQPA